MTQTQMGKILKGVYSALVAFLGGLAAILTGSAGLGTVTAGQWVTLALSALLAGGGTYGLSPWSGPAALNGKKPDGG